MSPVIRMRWLVLVLAGLCVMVLVPGAAGYAAASGGQARHDLATAVPAVPAPPTATGNLTAVGCFSTADCVAVGSAYSDVADKFSVRSVAERWNGAGWTPAGLPAGGGLSAVACPGARVCQAVGGGTAERWNGRGWIAEKTPAALRGASLTGVACAAASACIAVGTRSRGRPPVAETWNGSAWAAHNLVNPAGALQASLSSVSCAGKTFCVAVGNYQSAAGQTTLAESWNGHTWTMLAMPPAGTSAGLTSVSCDSSASCVAVGGDGFQPLAESWNGTTWTVMPAPLDRSQTVSCTAAANCMAVGGSSAMAWNGSSWKALRMPPRAPFTWSLTAVSCPAAKSCMAVGQADDIGSLAMSWNGSAWRPLRVDRADVLSAVSCTRATRCMATGSFVTASGRVIALTESWNGSSWRRHPASHAADSGLSDVSCTSAARCIAVGAISDNASLAEAWNGTAWQVTPAPGPPGQFPTGLDAVSCRGVTCLTLGTFGGAWVWNGAAWQAVQDGGGVTDVSCARPAYCLGVGRDFISPDEPPVSLARLWNGTSWRRLNPPNSSALNTVSCASASFCMAAGFNFADIWNGRSWRMRKLPGSFGIGGPGITGVSCLRRSACMVVGNYVALVGSSYEGVNVAEFWNGTRWRRLPTVGLGGGLTDVSCTSASKCMAVGLSPAGPAGTRALADRWNGRHWRLLAIPNP